MKVSESKYEQVKESKNLFKKCLFLFLIKEKICL